MYYIKPIFDSNMDLRHFFNRNDELWSNFTSAFILSRHRAPCCSPTYPTTFIRIVACANKYRAFFSPDTAKTLGEHTRKHLFALRRITISDAMRGRLYFEIIYSPISEKTGARKPPSNFFFFSFFGLANIGIRLQKAETLKREVDDSFPYRSSKRGSVRVKDL